MNGQLKRGLLVIVGLLLLPVVVWLSGYLLPSEVTLRTEREVDANPAAIFLVMSTRQGLVEWWQQVATDMGEDLAVSHIDGPEAGVSMIVGFSAGTAPVFETWTYTAARPGEAISMDVDFGIFTSKRTLTLIPTPTGTRVRWVEVATVEAPHWRWVLKLGEASAIKNRQRVIAAAAETATSL